MDKFKQLFLELKDLNFARDDFAIFGSGPMAVRGIKESRDLDIVVKNQLWKKLIKNHKVYFSQMGGECLHLGEIEIFHDWKPWFDNSEELINSSDIIDGIRFVNLKYVLQWKIIFGREKDLKDIRLIEEYLKKNS